jgi:hypothetical protein
METYIKSLYNHKATTEDIHKEPDTDRNLVDEFGEDAAGNTADTAIAATKYTVAEGDTLMIASVDIESDVESVVYLKKSVATTVSILRQYKLAAKGHLNVEYQIPFSVAGTASGTATETFVQLFIKQPVAGRISAGFNGRLIET